MGYLSFSSIEDSLDSEILDTELSQYVIYPFALQYLVIQNWICYRGMAIGQAELMWLSYCINDNIMVYLLLVMTACHCPVCDVGPFHFLYGCLKVTERGYDCSLVFVICCIWVKYFEFSVRVLLPVYKKWPITRSVGVCNLSGGYLLQISLHTILKLLIIMHADSALDITCLQNETTVICCGMFLSGLSADEPISITMQLPYEWNVTLCHSSRHHSCGVVHIYTCVNFQALEFVFPPGRFVCM